ncbi:MAG: TIGR03564 family F420-dependent LLM class oxidoreductase, partial [Myxococcales bacterium]|nr:TIGR03564 family F420-dependent LLM class oxidoreductase [Myxococcales bacterium]
MKIGILVGEGAGARPTVEQAVGQAKQAEDEGFATAWLVNLFGNDPMILAGLVGHVTERIEIGTAVVPTYTRHPHVMAQQTLTIQAASHNRFTLGIGLSHQIVIEAMMGLSWAKPYSHMKEYLQVLQPLLKERRVAHKGDEFTVNSNLVVKGAEVPQLVIAAMAPKMLALAGGTADGTVTWMTGRKTLTEYVVPRIREAAEATGRSARVIACLPVCVTEDKEAERAAVDKGFAMYGNLPSYRAMLDKEGAATPSGVAVLGSEAEIEDELAALAEAGVTDFAAALYKRDEDGVVDRRTREFLATKVASFS